MTTILKVFQKKFTAISKGYLINMILQVVKMYPPDVGGVETVAQQYSQILSTREEVVVLCSNSEPYKRTLIEKDQEVTIYRCSSFGKAYSMPLSLSFFFYFFKLQKKASVIHIHEPFPMATLAAFFVKKKIVVTWHSDIIRQKIVGTILKFFQDKVLLNAQAITTTSEALLRFSKQLRRHIEKVEVIPLTIDPQEYIEEQKESENDINGVEDDFVLFIGRLSYYKGISIFLEAIEKTKSNIKFLIVGTGELSKEVSELTKISNKDIHFINHHVSDKAKKQLLRKCKFMVLPSTHNSEAFGITQLEAMIYGKPVINTNLPTGVPWVSIDNVSGLTVEPSDSRQLAEAMETLYNDEVLYKRLSDGASHRVKTYFTDEVSSNLLLSLYNSKDLAGNRDSKFNGQI